MVPCYGSEKYLGSTVRELIESLQGRHDFEIVLVNDGSPDDVQRVIDHLATEDSRIRFVELGGNLGQHAATLRGLAEARGDVVVTIDDDGQNPPSAVLTTMSELERGGYDVVYGAFRQRAQSPLRRFASSANRWMSRYVIGNRSKVSISNVRAIQGELARVVGASPIAFPFVDAMLFRATRRVGEVKIEHRDRTSGDSTYTLGKLVRLWFSHLTTFSVLPLRIATIGSFSVSTLGLAVGVIQIVRALSRRQAPQGWLSLFVAVTFLFSVLFLFMGILSIYVGRLYVASNLGTLRWERKQPSVPTDTATTGAQV